MSLFEKCRWMVSCTFLAWILMILLMICAGIAIHLMTPIPQGCVSTEHKICAKIGGMMMEKGGTTADAVIATLLCESVHYPGGSGIGGGLIMVIYYQDEGVQVLNAMGVAPEKVKRNMFLSIKEKPIRGARTVLVPGGVRGLGELHRKYGTLDWADLFKPSIDMCRNGVTMTRSHRMILKSHSHIIKQSEALRRIFLDPKTNNLIRPGSVFKMPILADTLEIIANEGADSMYNGTIAKRLLQDVPGLLITPSDLANYNPKWEKALMLELKTGHLLYAPGIPTSGALIIFLFQIMNHMITTNGYSSRNWSKIVEGFKFMYGVKRYLEDSEAGRREAMRILSKQVLKATIVKILEDQTVNDYSYYAGSNYEKPLDTNTVHVSILSGKGNGISATATIHSVFGSGVVSADTGIILNNDMEDFTTGPLDDDKENKWEDYNNTIAPFKQPMHSITPIIILNKDKSVRLVIGATGGARILTSISLVIMKHLFFDMDIKTSVNEYRLHHQLVPMILWLDEAYKNDKKMIHHFEFIKHNISYTNGTDVVTAVSNSSEQGVVGVSDERGPENSVYYIT